MILTTTLAHGGGPHLRCGCCFCGLPASRDWKYNYVTSVHSKGDPKYCCGGTPHSKSVSRYCCGGIAYSTSDCCHVLPQLLPGRCPHHELTNQESSTSIVQAIPVLPQQPSAAPQDPTMSWTLSSSLLSALIAVSFALTLLQLPSVACAATSRRAAAGVGRSYVSYPHQRFQYGSDEAHARRNDFVTPARNSRRVGAATGLGGLHPKFGRGRKMLFGTLSCAPQDLSLTQGPVSSTSGIPTFDVQIVNLCGVCAMGEIHVACGNWASATPVDPFVFTRLGYNDCLVNNGRPLSSQGSVSFQYSNSAMYPMTITSATSNCHR